MLLPWLRLFRLAGLTTIFSNLLAVLVASGLASADIARELLQHRPDALWVLAASVSVYLAGMIWNDLCDVERDILIAPRRPLPSGQISYFSAWMAGVICAVLALFFAAQLGWRGFCALSIVLSCALLYNVGLKNIPWLGSLAMAATRASHAVFAMLMLGPEHFDALLLSTMSLFNADLRLVGAGSGQHSAYPLMLGAYIFGITLMSELEHRRSYRWELLIATVIIAASLLWVVLHGAFQPRLRDLLIERQVTAASLIIGGLLLLSSWAVWRLGVVILPALRLASRQLIGPFMVRALSGIIIFDAIFVVVLVPELTLVVLCLLPPFLVIGRLARMD
ncbi:MAG: hypothetical protein EA402_08865 [Planctomycetota bacterium]|nr:MAG: hypothetical protein EA402_08865 [Planctomycetota bacterium]